VISATWFPNEHPTAAQRTVAQYASFPELVAALGPPRPYPRKMGIPMFSPCEWPPGTKKDLPNAMRVHFGVFDYDDVPMDDIAELLGRMDVPFMFCSSWSHGDPIKTQEALKALRASRKTPASTPDRFASAWEPQEGPELVRGRLVVPFSRPVGIDEWRTVSHALQKRYAWKRAIADRSCVDATHCYFVPAHPANPPAQPIYIDQSLGRHLWGGVVR